VKMEEEEVVDENEEEIKLKPNTIWFINKN
jgi:hypothetical protein